MKNWIPLFRLLIGLSIILVFNPSHAEALGKEGLENLLSGNTAEGYNIQWNKKNTWYFKKDMRLKKLDEYGNKAKGKWYVNDNGQLCTEFKNRKKNCMDVTPLSGGGYEISFEGEPKWRFDRIVKGNPHDL